MTLKKSSKRPKTVGQEAEDANKPSGGPFLLPTELILEITSHLSDITYDKFDDGWSDNDIARERQNTLRALSQTSRLLRNICLPFLWERVDVRPQMNGGGSGWVEILHEKLGRTLGLIKNPSLAAYVRIFDVFVETDNAALISRLVTCLSLLPNMHTLCIKLHGDGRLHGTFSTARFPQVRTLVISACDARMLVPSCPQVRAVISSARMKGWSDLVGLFDESGETLEHLDGFSLSPDTFEYIAECTPNLKSLKFVDWVNHEHLLSLKPLKKLHTIEMLVVHDQYRRHRQNPKPAVELDRWMATARELLSGNEGRQGQRHGGKRIKMSYRWVDHMNKDENQEPLVQGRVEDVEVD